MDYIVVDLEWNQSMVALEKNQCMPFEIIEIGAVKLNEEWDVIDSFSELIKPQLYTRLHYLIKGITHMKKEELLQGDFFENVIERFFSWCGENFIFCTWGSMDLTELQKNISFYHLEGYIDKPVIYYDIQKLFRLQNDGEKNIRTLEYAVDVMGITKEDFFHRALSDAKYTALVLQKLDKKIMKDHYSIDCFHNPKSKSEEIHIRNDDFSKYISMEFNTKEELFKNREISSSRCCKCGRGSPKKIRWFTSNSKCYYCLAYCKDHGFLKGKVSVKKTLEGKFYVMKTIKLVDEEIANEVRCRQEEVKAKKREKNSKKK